MIRCNLSILLAERNLKITKVSNDTGISRTTLTYLANNYSKGIQYDTLNTLCNYLHVSPQELISYVPVDIYVTRVNRTGEDGKDLEIELNIVHGNVNKTCELHGDVELYFPDSDDPYFTTVENLNKPDSLSVFISMYNPIGEDPELEEENNLLKFAFHLLPVSFLTDLEQTIIQEVVNDLDYDYNLETLPEPIATSLSWDSELLPLK